jgi:hypothetical protein
MMTFYESINAGHQKGEKTRRLNRVLKNKHQAVSPGNIRSQLNAPNSKEKPLSAQLSAPSFELSSAS